MGKKINPVLFRLGKINNYHSLWFSSFKNYNKKLKCDILLREIIKRSFSFLGLNYIDLIISNLLKINFYFNNVNYIFNYEKYLDLFVFEISKVLKLNVIINFIIDKKINSKIISNILLNQLDNKISVKKLIKKELLKLINNFKGCKVQISGRIEGVDIARIEWILIGSIPLHTIRYEIDYNFCEIITQYGSLGIKIWVFKKNNEK